MPIGSVVSLDASEPTQAAHGEDQLQSQPSNGAASLPVSKSWNTHLPAAHGIWTKISEADLAKTEGNREMLGALVEKSYSIHRSEADKQVKSFFDRRNS